MVECHIISSWPFFGTEIWKHRSGTEPLACLVRDFVDECESVGEF